MSLENPKAFRKILRKSPASDMPELQFLVTKSTKLKKLKNWVNFSILNSFLSSLLMVAPSFLVNMEILKDGNVKLDARFKINVGKWRLLLVLKLNKQLKKIKG